MKAILITDELRWHRDWSSRLGTRLDTKDSSNNLLIFEKNCTEEDILRIIARAPRDIYRILDLEEAAEEDCDVMGDSGACYRNLH